MPAASLAAIEHGGADLAVLLARSEHELDEAETADRPRLFDAAAAACVSDPLARLPLVLLDVAIPSPAEAGFVAALARAATQVLATCPAHDAPACHALLDAGGTIDVIDDDAVGDLASLRRHLFDEASPPMREPRTGW